MPARFLGFIRTDAFVILPDHFHGIIFIDECPSGMGSAGKACPATDMAASNKFVPAALVAADPQNLNCAKRPTLGDVIGALKSITTVEYIRGVRDFG